MQLTIFARAGDTRLPHSAASNIGDAPRVAQYITMNPASPLSDEDIADNRRWWSERLAGVSAATLGWTVAAALTVDLCCEQFGEPVNREHYTLPRPATLSPLGKRLAGIEPWPAHAAAASAKL